MKSSLNVAVVGAGNIGAKRMAAIVEAATDQVVGIFDINSEKASFLARQTQTQVFASWQELLKDQNIDVVIIATTTDTNVKMALEALTAGKHVLAEKPLGSTKEEAQLILSAQQKSGKMLKVGFNHRHHPAIMQAHQMVSEGAVGDILFIRSIYGHGARPGYDLEWRMNKKISPGGELFDQGVHIIDLANWFLGNFTKVFAQTRNFYWDRSELDDNAFCQLYTDAGQIVSFHVSLTQWVNRFSFEVFGNKGYLIINGLGKSYGKETLIVGSGVGQGKVPNEKVFEFPGKDVSWRDEWVEFRSAILANRQPLAAASDNVVVTTILENLYTSSVKQKIISL